MKIQNVIRTAENGPVYSLILIL